MQFKEEFQHAYELFGGYGERVLGMRFAVFQCPLLSSKCVQPGFAHLELDEKQYPSDRDHSYKYFSLSFFLGPGSALMYAYVNGSSEKKNFPQDGYVFLGMILLRLLVLTALLPCRADFPC